MLLLAFYPWHWLMAADTPIPSSNMPLPSQQQSLQSAKQILIKQVQFIDFVPRPAQGLTLEKLRAVIKAMQLQWGVYLSVAEIHSLADQITRLYRNAGFSFTRVIVPPQEIKNHQLQLQIIEGTLGDIQVRGADHYGAKTIKRPFQGLLNRVVTQQQIQQALAIVNQYPGLEVYGYFSKGSKPHQTRLNLKVQKEQWLQATLKADNYGSENTGLYRATGYITVNNPLGFADRLTLGVLQSLDIGNQAQENNTYGSIAYQAMITPGGSRIGLLAGNHQFELGQAFSDLGVEGEAEHYRLDLTVPWRRTRWFSSDVNLYGEQKQTDITSALDTDLLDKQEQTQKLAIALQLNHQAKHALASQFRWGQALNLGIYAGDFDIEFGQDTAMPTLSDNLQTLFINYSLFGQYYHQGKAAYRWQFSLKGQYSDQRLPDVETFTLSGPYGVRAYEQGLLSADQGGVASLQWFWLSPDWLGNNGFSRTVKPFVFYDAAYGERLADGAISELREQIIASGYGLGFDIRYPANGSNRSGWWGRFTLARRDSLKSNPAAADRDLKKFSNNPVIYGELSYRF